MKLAGVTCLIYGLIIALVGVVLCYFSAGVASLIGGLVFGGVMLVLGRFTLKGVLGAGYTGGILTFLMAIYFAYRLLATERFVPSGVLLLVSFTALFLIALGVFLGLNQNQEE
jgi:hypothetical protein